MTVAKRSLGDSPKWLKRRIKKEAEPEQDMWDR